MPVPLPSVRLIRRNDMRLVDNIIPLPVITTIPIPVERVLQSAIAAELQIAIVIGYDKDGDLYFASSAADSGEILWWIEKAKKDLLSI